MKRLSSIAKVAQQTGCSFQIYFIDVSSVLKTPHKNRSFIDVNRNPHKNQRAFGRKTTVPVQNTLRTKCSESWVLTPCAELLYNFTKSPTQMSLARNIALLVTIVICLHFFRNEAAEVVPLGYYCPAQGDNPDRVYAYFDMANEESREVSVNTFFNGKQLRMRLDSGRVMTVISAEFPLDNPSDFKCHEKLILSSELEGKEPLVGYLCMTTFAMPDQATTVEALVQVLPVSDFRFTNIALFGWNAWKAVKLDLTTSEAKISWAKGNHKAVQKMGNVKVVLRNHRLTFADLLPFDKMPFNITESYKAADSRNEVLVTKPELLGLRQFH